MCIHSGTSRAVLPLLYIYIYNKAKDGIKVAAEKPTGPRSVSVALELLSKQHNMSWWWSFLVIPDDPHHPYPHPEMQVRTLPLMHQNHHHSAEGFYHHQFRTLPASYVVATTPEQTCYELVSGCGHLFRAGKIIFCHNLFATNAFLFSSRQKKISTM